MVSGTTRRSWARARRSTNIARLSFFAANPSSAFWQSALIATVIGLLVAIPAMFAYNFMVTTIRAITQEMDDFTAEYAVHLEHRYVQQPRLAEDNEEIERSLRKCIDVRDKIGVGSLDHRALRLVVPGSV